MPNPTPSRRRVSQIPASSYETALVADGPRLGKPATLRDAHEGHDYYSLAARRTDFRRARHDGFAGLDAAYVDRPVPGDGSSFFEDLHDYKDLETFGVGLQALAKANHGWLGFYFVSELARALASDRAEVVRFFEARRRAYKRQASKIVAPGRNLNRVHGKLATVYAAGCFAIRFKLLPFNFAELLGAVLTCERDHVAFVAKELGEAVASAGNPIAAAKSSPYARLKAYVFGPARKKFIDLREPARACRRGISTTALPATWASMGATRKSGFAQIAVAPDSIAKGSSRPEGDLQVSRDERLESERRRSSAQSPARLAL